MQSPGRSSHIYSHHLNNYFLQSLQKQIKHEQHLYRKLQRGLKQLHHQQQNIFTTKNSHHHSHLQFKNRHVPVKKRSIKANCLILSTSTSNTALNSSASSPTLVRRPPRRPTTALQRPQTANCGERELGVRGGRVVWSDFEHTAHRALTAKKWMKWG